jgi:hypothetical protein
METPDWASWIGKKVWKKSRSRLYTNLKPFPFGRVGTIKELIVHPITGNPTFTFDELEGYFVECRKCELYVEDQWEVHVRPLLYAPRPELVVDLIPEPKPAPGEYVIVTDASFVRLRNPPKGHHSLMGWCGFSHGHHGVVSANGTQFCISINEAEAIAILRMLESVENGSRVVSYCDSEIALTTANMLGLSDEHISQTRNHSEQSHCLRQIINICDLVREKNLTLTPMRVSRRDKMISVCDHISRNALRKKMTADGLIQNLNK